MTTEINILRSVGGLTFDATFEESHESELNVTDNPVETGVTVSDHAYMSPLRLTITAGVTNTPLYTPGSDQFASEVSRRIKAYELLTTLQRNAEPFDVQTGLKLYKNMLCLNVRTVDNKDNANVLDFVAELREVIIVNTQVVTYPPRREGKPARQAGKTRDKGEVAAKEAGTGTNAEAKKKQSLAKKLFNTVGARP
jgi:hypothetical protein